MHRAWLVVVLAACGGGAAPPPEEPAKPVGPASVAPDTCAQAMDKLAPVLKRDAAATQQATADCRQAREQGTAKAADEALIACVLDAKDQQGVETCVRPPVKDESPAARAVEASEKLHALGEAAKRVHASDGFLPTGTTGPTPALGCCQQDHDNKKQCMTPEATWRNDVLWSKLGFSVVGPSNFQYTLKSEANQLTATAVGDLDCDGTPITYTLVVTASGQTVNANVSAPSPGSD